jgi:hypothetical protein
VDAGGGTSSAAAVGSSFVATGATPDLRAARLYLGLAMAVTACSLAWLGHVYEGQVFGWELAALAQITQWGLGPEGLAMLGSQGWLWSANLISDSANEPFFAVPTAIALKSLGVGTWSARLVAMGWALACVPLAFAMVRRFFSPAAAAGTAAFLALSPFFLFGAVHAFALSVNRFFALLAVFAVLEFCRPRRPRWRDGVVCAAALYLATVQYTPGRLVPIIGLGLIVAVEASELAAAPGRWLRARAGRFALLVVLAGAIVAVQVGFGRLEHYLSGGGESLLGLAGRTEFWRGFNGRPETAASPELRDMVAAGLHLGRLNAPEVAWHLRPTWGERDPHWLAVECPPRIRLLLWWPAPFVLAGLAWSLRRFREPPHAMMLLWLGLSIPPALLSTFLRAYRIDLWMFPLAVWFGLGLELLARRCSALPLRRWGHVAAVAAIVGLAGYNLSLFCWPGSYGAEGPAARAMAARVRAAGGDLYAEARFLHNWTDLTALTSLERRLTRPAVVTELSFSNGATRPWRDVLATRREAGDRRPLTLLLAPASTFGPELEELRRDWGAAVRLEPLADSTLAVVVPE